MSTKPGMTPDRSQPLLFGGLAAGLMLAVSFGALTLISGWEFDVVFDTHSQEQTDDLLKPAMLIASRPGEAAPRSFRWTQK